MPKTGKYTLTFWIFAGFILGIVTGAVVGEPVVPYVEPLANIFLRLLRMAIIPLVLTSIISAVAQVGTAHGLGRIGLEADPCSSHCLYHMLNNSNTASYHESNNGRVRRFKKSCRFCSSYWCNNEYGWDSSL
ncbi:MAG: cation:dicarboxylase symporter family transporter [Bacteroidota bacterium]|nr:cation:dicarboxylase symporter family transporter [Bacteroidota bacterium]